jgi:hypothetical protein
MDFIRNQFLRSGNVKRVIYILMTILVLTACAPADTPHPQPTVVPTPDGNGNSLPSESIDIEKLLADPDYLAECKSINPSKSDKQAGYLGVYPGITHPNDVETLLGKPLNSGIINEPSAKYRMTNYQTFSVRIDLAGSKTEFIHVNKDTHYPTALEIISQYGCPDMVYKRSLDEEGDSNYSTVVFIYHKKVGLRVDFEQYPLSLKSNAYSILYFIPDTAENVLKLFGFYHADGYAAPATWDDAIAR